MLVTQEMIWNELQTIKKMMQSIIDKNEQFSIEEVSLNKACKLLHLGNPTIIELVKSGKLKARIYRDSKTKLRYRFLLKDISEFQNSNKYEEDSYELTHIESTESMMKRIVEQHHRKSKKKAK